MSEPLRPVFIASWNGAPATSHAARLHVEGTPLLDAIVAGIGLVEDDPDEMSVGFGGLPNEDGVVELDAGVMSGPLHKAGAVAGLRSVRCAARVALEVLRRTDHALLVGEGALAFARKLGLPEENLLTPRARDAWLAWKASLSTRDAWLGPDELHGREASAFDPARWAGHADNPTPGAPPPPAAGGETAAPRTPPPGASGGSPTVPFTFGTIHVSGLDAAGNVYAATSTSGLSYKIAGRAGDSPIVGAGLYVDNDVGSAGATGRGEATLQNCAAFAVVEAMARGLPPAQACLEVLRGIARRTREPRLLSRGRPVFNVTLYALRRDGECGSASMHEGYTHVVQRGLAHTITTNTSVYSKDQ